MFLRPQHFQQHDRWLERFIEMRGGPLRNHPWGFVELQLDRELLKIGKLSLRLARGVFADGTPFDFPNGDDAPAPLDLDSEVRDQIIYLCLPARRDGAPEVARGDVNSALARYQPVETEVRDSNADNPVPSPIEIGKPRLRLIRAGEPRDGYHCLGVVRVVEVRADKSVTLDENYIPPVLECQASEYLKAFMGELQGILAQRGHAVAARVVASGKGGAAELADTFTLLMINRYEPVVGHLAVTRGVHPEEFYRLALAIAGEAATFTTSERRPKTMPPYQHDDLRLSFVPLVAELRRTFTTVIDPRAIAIKLVDRSRGFHAGVIPDRRLIGNAYFVLAIAADMPAEDLRRRTQTSIKVGPPNSIKDFVIGQIPGIKLAPQSDAPREIPYYAGYIYFELDPRSQFWADVKSQGGGIVLHVGDEFPGLKLELWAIRNG